MANDCLTRIQISGPQEEINTFWVALEEAEKLREEGDGFWLGYIPISLGVWDAKSGAQPPYSVRGNIDYWELDDDTVTLDLDTAWAPHLGAIGDLLQRYAPNTLVWYEAEEPGAEIYWTNDPELEGMWQVDVPEELMGILGEGCEPIDEDFLYKSLSDYVGGFAQHSIEDLFELLDKKKGILLSANRWESVPFEDCCL